MNLIIRKLVPASAALIILLSASLALIPPRQAQAYTCPTSSTRTYTQDGVYQWDLEDNDKVRPNYNHPDKTLYMRGHETTGGTLGFVNYGASHDTGAPQFATLFNPSRVPTFTQNYKIHQWKWGTSPNPGSRIANKFETHPIPSGYPGADRSVTMLGVATIPGEVLRSPENDYDLGPPWGKGAVVINADSTHHSISLHFTLEDTVSEGYTLMIEGVCVDPELQALYDDLDNNDRNPPPSKGYGNGNTPHDGTADYDLPGLKPSQVFGTAMDTEIRLVVRDSGDFADPRAKNDWWRVRPGPTGPTLTNPANGSTVADLTPQFDWNPVPSPTDYQIEIAGDNTFTGSTPVSLGASTLTYTPASDMAQGKYFWRVRGGAALPWSATWSFTIDLKPPAPVTVAPKGPINDTTPAFQWEPAGSGLNAANQYTLTLKQSGTVLHSVQYSVGVDLTCGATCSVDPFTNPPSWPALVEGPYAFTVQGSNTYGDGAVSAARSFNVDLTPPAVPYNNSPKDKVVTTSGKPRLTARKVSDGAQYHFQVLKASDLSVLRNGTSSGSWTINPPLDYGDYLWRVSAIDAAGNESGFSHPFELIVSRMRGPKDESATTDSTPKFIWSTFSGAPGWELAYTADPDGNPTDGVNDTIIAKGHKSTNYTVPSGSKLPDGVYYWSLRPTGGTWMPVWTFTVSRMKTPRNEAVTSDTTPRFTWGKFNGATDLQLSVGPNADPNANTPFIAKPPTATSHTVPNTSPLSDGVYFWALSGNGGANWLPAWKLTVTHMKSPRDEALLTDLTPTFKWVKVKGVTMYHLYIDTDTDFTGVTPVTLGPKAKKYTVPGGAPLSRLTTYYWYLSADLSGGGTVSLPVWSFVER